VACVFLVNVLDGVHNRMLNSSYDVTPCLWTFTLRSLKYCDGVQKGQGILDLNLQEYPRRKTKFHSFLQSSDQSSSSEVCRGSQYNRRGRTKAQVEGV